MLAAMMVSDLHSRARMKLTFASLGLSVLLSLAACGGDGGSPADAAPGPAPDGASAPDAGGQACTSPFALPADPEARTRAQTALGALAPGATLEWSATRNTLSFVSSLNLELPGCTGDTNAYEPLFAFLEATPDLFQITRSDWRTDAPVTCASIDDGLNTLVIRRIQYGPLKLVNDVFHANLKLVDGKVVVTSVGGTYIPRADTGVVATIQACADLPAAELEAKLRAEPFAYANFEPPPAPICSLGPPGSYTATPADSLTIAADFELMWDEGEPVTIYKLKAATLLVDEAAITDELERSDANCPDDDFNPRVGWIRFFDPVNGRILGDKANPVPGCIVC
jgi:hypothetical protein